MGAREEILGRITAALGDVPAGSTPEEVPVPWSYGAPAAVDDVPALFAERVEDYRAVVERVAPDQVAERVAAVLADVGARRVVVPEGLPDGWTSAAREGDVELLADAGPMSATELDATDAVLTGAALGIATTGTIVLDHGPGQGRRALTLVPDVHLCVVGEHQLVGDVPEAIAALQDAVDAGRPLTWISGPSATSDIELDRVEGVHGPRTLHVLLVR